MQTKINDDSDGIETNRWVPGAVIFNLTWGDLFLVLSTYCTLEEKVQTWGKAQAYADSIVAQDFSQAVGTTARHTQDPNWIDQPGLSTLSYWNHMITYLIKAMKMGMSKWINYETVTEVTQERGDIHFQSPCNKPDPISTKNKWEISATPRFSFS